jgi:hypothetical protein
MSWKGAFLVKKVMVFFFLYQKTPFLSTHFSYLNGIDHKGTPAALGIDCCSLFMPYMLFFDILQHNLGIEVNAITIIELHLTDSASLPC